MRLIDADLLREDWLLNGQNEYVYNTNAFLESIDDAPTVDAEPAKRGKWIQETQTNSEGKAYFSCSECSADEFRSIFKEVSYCWNCGAKMESEE